MVITWNLDMNADSLLAPSLVPRWSQFSVPNPINVFQILMDSFTRLFSCIWHYWCLPPHNSLFSWLLWHHFSLFTLWSFFASFMNSTSSFCVLNIHIFMCSQLISFHFLTSPTGDLIHSHAYDSHFKAKDCLIYRQVWMNSFWNSELYNLCLRGTSFWTSSSRQLKPIIHISS